MVGVDRVELSSDVYKTPVLKPLYYTPLQKRIPIYFKSSRASSSKLNSKPHPFNYNVYFNLFQLIFPNGN